MKQSIRKTFSLSMFWNKRDFNAKTKQAPISLTVNLPRKQFRVSLKIYSTKEDFEKALSAARLSSETVKDLKQAMNEYLLKAESILSRLKDPTKESFVRLFKAETDLFLSNKTDVFFFYQMKMDEFMAQGRIGSYKNIWGSKVALYNYCKKVCFEDIDERWLFSYKSYMKAKGNSDTTVGIRLGCLRGMFITARKQGFISDQCNPFKSFTISKSVKSKSVLYPAQLKALYNYVPADFYEARAKDFFLFCYLGNGMNFMDMAHLRYRDIKKDTLTFIRQKTKLSQSSSVKEIRVHLHDDMKRIISTYGNEGCQPDDFIFPVLNPKSDLMEQDRERCWFKGRVNMRLNRIAKKLGFEGHLNLNLARHSFATMLKISGTPIAFISDAMGHTNSVTTEHYLKSIPEENMKSLSGQLLSFG